MSLVSQSEIRGVAFYDKRPDTQTRQEKHDALHD
jgi:hypothetical protein